MRILYDISDIPADLRGSVVALGNFDGVHCGHLSVLSHVRNVATEYGLPSGVVTFTPHPRLYLRQEKLLFTITPLEQKLCLLEALELDFTNILKFDASLACLSAEEFVKIIIVESWQASHVAVGYNFFFGKDKKGTPEILQDLGKKYGYGVTIIEPAGNGRDVFSSSAVRDFLRLGKVRKAAEILGHWWIVSGIVEHGARRGKSMGYPTANVTLEPGQALKHGIYAVRVWVDGERFNGAAYCGRRPTFDNGVAKLEVFLMNFNKLLYNNKVYIEFIEFIRSDKLFGGPEALASQIARDCMVAREILERTNSADPMSGYPLGEAMVQRIKSDHKLGSA
ncbi:MAG: Bifunctional riboflavin kinase/FMN adenylyltransferase [Hyphomicrobiaceae bacterium hypho_1]